MFEARLERKERVKPQSLGVASDSKRSDDMVLDTSGLFPIKVRWISGLSIIVVVIVFVMGGPHVDVTFCLFIFVWELLVCWDLEG